PPFRAGDVQPPTRLWWQVRLPLAWAATVALAFGIGTYLGNGVEPVPQAQTESDTQPAGRRALPAPISSELAQRASRVKVRGAVRTPPAAQPAAPAGAFVDGVPPVAQAGAALPDSLTVSERAQAGRSRRADSLAALPRDAALRRAPQPAANRTSADLFRDVRGPLSADSLAALRRLLQPLRP